MFESWQQGANLTFVRYDDYWGEPAMNERLVFHWSEDSAARLAALQSGAVHLVTDLAWDDYPAVENEPNLILLPQANPNIAYLGLTNNYRPLNDRNLRLAIAKGIDRQRIVDNYYPPGSVVATHFTPCEIPNGCDGDDWYVFDIDAAKQHLADAGFPNGFDTKIYLRDVYRSYLPDPHGVAIEIQTQLKENLNIDSEIVVMESNTFIDESTNGRLDGLYLLGWGADYMHVTNFLDFHFGRNTLQFGNPYPEIFEPLEAAASRFAPGTFTARSIAPSGSWFLWSPLPTVPPLQQRSPPLKTRICLLLARRTTIK